MSNYKEFTNHLFLITNFLTFILKKLRKIYFFIKIHLIT